LLLAEIIYGKMEGVQKREEKIEVFFLLSSEGEI
jgi:hypothetical protein